MRVAAGLPGTIGLPPQRHHTPLTSTLAIIGMCLGLLGLSVFGMPSIAWASTGPSVNTATPPSPYPNPGDPRAPGNSAPRLPLIPVPPPPGPRSIATGYDHLVKPVAWVGVPARADDLAAAVPTPAPAPAAASGSEPDRPDLARSLIYSGALALVIAGSGLIMLGSRRRLW